MRTTHAAIRQRFVDFPVLDNNAQSKFNAHRVGAARCPAAPLRETDLKTGR